MAPSIYGATRYYIIYNCIVYIIQLHHVIVYIMYTSCIVYCLVLSLPFTDGQRNIYVRSIYPHFFKNIGAPRRNYVTATSLQTRNRHCNYWDASNWQKLLSYLHCSYAEGEQFLWLHWEERHVIVPLKRLMLRNSSVVHLIDPCFSLDVYPAVTVFFASPTESNFEPYHSKEMNTYFMPLWTREELMDAHSKLSLTFEEDIFRFWGGVFLDSYRSNLLHSHLTKILQSGKLLQLVQVTDDFTLSPDINHCQWLIHRVPSSDYRSCVCEVPSDYL